MASYSRIENFKVKTNQAFLDKAAQLEPILYKKVVLPKKIIDLENTDNNNNINQLSAKTFAKGEQLILDFGDHQVGHVSFTIVPSGSHFDAPAYLHIKFAEVIDELYEHSSDYHGWLSRSWIQEEWIHLDILPQTITLNRRYAFRYMQIEVIDTSPKYEISFRNIYCIYESAQNMDEVKDMRSGDALLDQIDRVSRKTLADCMQKVFEDGVKRDRRLWLGDLRLQAKANYVTFRNYDLVKRCLYLFAGMTFDDGRIGACFFHEPSFCVDDTYLMDYALLFVPTLYDYYEASNDKETLCDLYSSAMNQIDICLETMVDDNHVVIDKGDEFWCFLDWSDGLNKQAGAQAVLIYAIAYGLRLAEIMNDHERIRKLKEEERLLKEAAIKNFWDEKQGVFVSGNECQVSWATQAWMVLAHVFNQEKSRQLILHTMHIHPDVGMVTPYMYHHFIEALICCGEKNIALEEMKKYWGEMILDGADTFWELYNPQDKKASPYGSTMVNSYCHAWSCTPTYFLRQYFIYEQ